ncbi:uncharacterized protein LOC132655404 [Meriones unguiculatus]|uniref:uncharacterized protein LOC132655404 n=1 Tax=Meriones unguiculatus TaxID=10047 RepID=UPI00293E0285|nr:uncharacterized protein LOC132655404 [Meriones unguiculatus]
MHVIISRLRASVYHFKFRSLCFEKCTSQRRRPRRMASDPRTEARAGLESLAGFMGSVKPPTSPPVLRASQPGLPERLLDFGPREEFSIDRAHCTQSNWLAVMCFFNNGSTCTGIQVAKTSGDIVTAFPPCTVSSHSASMGLHSSEVSGQAWELDTAPVSVDPAAPLLHRGQLQVHGEINEVCGTRMGEVKFSVTADTTAERGHRGELAIRKETRTRKQGYFINAWFCTSGKRPKPSL